MGEKIIYKCRANIRKAIDIETLKIKDSYREFLNKMGVIEEAQKVLCDYYETIIHAVSSKTRIYMMTEGESFQEVADRYIAKNPNMSDKERASWTKNNIYASVCYDEKRLAKYLSVRAFDDVFRAKDKKDYEGHAAALEDFKKYLGRKAGAPKKVDTRVDLDGIDLRGYWIGSMSKDITDEDFEILVRTVTPYFSKIKKQVAEEVHESGMDAYLGYLINTEDRNMSDMDKARKHLLSKLLY